MRAYNTLRRPRRISKNQRTAPQPAAPPAAPSSVPVLTEVVEEEEDFDFIAIDDESSSQQSALCDSSSSILLPIEEKEPSNSDVAVSILEDFFFGSNSTQKQLPPPPTSTSKKQQRSTICVQQQHDSVYSDLSSSPTSTIMDPACSCSQLHGLNGTSCSSSSIIRYNYSSNSLPASPTTKQPKRPSIKLQSRGPSNNELMTSSKRNVSFTDISVREYDVELSDHPSCSFGPPIQLGWAYQETETTSVEDYEVTRSPHRREVHELVLSYNTRRRRLKQCGYKKKEIKRAQQEVDRIKRERLITEFFLPASAIDETFERVFENLRGWFQRPQRRRCREVVCQIHSPHQQKCQHLQQHHQQ